MDQDFIWEYRVETLPENSEAQNYRLNEAGKDGWELVIVVKTSLNVLSAYFKRAA